MNQVTSNRWLEELGFLVQVSLAICSTINYRCFMCFLIISTHMPDMYIYICIYTLICVDIFIFMWVLAFCLVTPKTHRPPTVLPGLFRWTVGRQCCHLGGELCLERLCQKEAVAASDLTRGASWRVAFLLQFDQYQTRVLVLIWLMVVSTFRMVLVLEY